MSAEREVILEIEAHGEVAKVSAIDVATMIEVSVMGPADDALALEKVAIAKLERALIKARRSNSAPARRSNKGGVVI